MDLLILSLVVFSFFIPSNSASEPILGVESIKINMYRSSSDTFTCFDGSMTMPFSRVNDDYCDCPDSSDEPGTDACPNGRFYCQNVQYVGKYIPSGMVNDRICDCCDGSDERTTDSQCVNSCLEHGKALREEEARQREVVRLGLIQKDSYAEQGSAMKLSSLNRKDELDAEIITAQEATDSSSGRKVSSEAIEKELVDSFNADWNAGEEERVRQSALLKMETAFLKIDSDGNGVISMEEMLSWDLFDVDKDGSVSNDEVRGFIPDKDVILWDTFPDVWENVKELFTTEAVDEVEQKDVKPPFNEETQQAVNRATEARDDYELKKSHSDSLSAELVKLNKFLNIYFGPEDEFILLYGKCFDFSDLEYTYTFCPYDRASQRSKNGGSDSNLGSWDKWSPAPGGDGVPVQMFSNGQSCWNGPNRSTSVSLLCSNEEALVSASEPNRCTYSMVFHTPMACSKSMVFKVKNEFHQEL